MADRAVVACGHGDGRLGLEAVIDEAVRPVRTGRGSGARALSLVASMPVAGSFIDDADRLRAGSAQSVLPFEVLAPSSLGTWLRSFVGDMSAGSTRRKSWPLSGRGLRGRCLRGRR